ncbi:pilus assembly protein CpaF [Methylotenera oryzisoli]|jgi:pilus assembly protein CpaF|uniref:Pilus assembly protein CpaF n=1 Tax=Methylotenera oryzisoli TaxID=2080758 RepID=A0A4Y9VV94_9PROT|nr:CpaF family protein [Methylotenera oryzisoli]TFW73077.1 pilus assembly protein CpaF [Methylotenera oryzisoli]
MSLRDRLEDVKNDAVLEPQGNQANGLMGNKVYQELRSRIHRKLLDRVDLSMMENMAPELLTTELKVLVERLLTEEAVAINDVERMNLVRDIQHEVLGLGPLEILMADPTISDILVNTYNQIYIERKGKLELSDVRFESEAHLLKIIDKIVSGVGRRVDESSPMVDARLPDGSRVNAIIPPLAVDGAILSIRRFAITPLMMKDLLHYKSLTPEMAEVLEGLVKAKVNILISGGTGTGKTTLLNVLSGYIPESERIITIEDAAELQLQQPHVVRLEIRPPNIEGKGEVTPRMLVRNSLRMRPDRIIVGEVRGPEVVDMLQAMNTGHEGSMATVHANTPRDALTRLENMMGMAGFNLPTKAMREQISSALTAIVHITRLSDGQRKVTNIKEITGMESEIITMQDIFVYEQTGVSDKGVVQGHLKATGIRPKFVERLRVHGVQISDSLFDPTKLYE